jgi:hypothetical protein
VQLYFDNKEQAVDWAKANGYKFELRRHHDEVITEPGTYSYSHNFLTKRVIFISINSDTSYLYRVIDDRF